MIRDDHIRQAKSGPPHLATVPEVVEVKLHLNVMKSVRVPC